jgi:hypothetical protein
MPFDGAEVFDRRERMLRELDRVTRLLDREDKWCKNHYRTWQGRHCILGALIVTGNKGLLYDLILESARDVSGYSVRSIVRFNDSPATDHGLVLAVLDRARNRILRGDIPETRRPRSFLARILGRLKPLEA